MDTWESDDSVTIEVSEGYTSTSVKLVVRKFKPIKGDVLERSWVGKGGEKKSVTIPPFAIEDLTAPKLAYEQYITVMMGEEFFKGALDSNDPLLLDTYGMAITTSKDKDMSDSQRGLLNMVLRLWVVIRLNTKSTNIVGSERLGMPADILGATGRIPIPPVMGNQIELILSREFQDPLRCKILDELRKLTGSNEPGCWFTIYLCTFILLHNCSMITRHDFAYARKHDLKTRFARPETVEEYHASATTLLAHFHHCHMGFSALSDAGDKAAGLTESQIQSIQKTRGIVADKDYDYGSYSDKDYFILQMLEENWEPRHRYKVSEDPTAKFNYGVAIVVL